MADCERLASHQLKWEITDKEEKEHGIVLMEVD